MRARHDVRYPPKGFVYPKLTLANSGRCDIILAAPNAVFGQPEINVRPASFSP
jgi:hypothetical protein